MIYRATLYLFAILFVWGSVLLPAQAQQVLDQQFKYLLQQDPQAMQAGTVSIPSRLQHAEVTLDDGTVGYRAFVQTNDLEQLRREGIAVQSYQGGIATTRLRIADLQALSSMEGVTRVAAPAVLTSHNDETAGNMGASPLHQGAINNTEYRGQGVLSCVIDSGIDVNHDDFKDESGNTRIQYLWDQTDATGPSPEDRDGAFAGLNHGTEYTAADIDGGGVNQEDTDGHGTHVAGTMAGNGRALVESGVTTAPRHVGIAPASDLVVVKAGDGSFSGANVADALDYCGTVSDEEGKPVVVNMSLGTSFGPHDGTSFLAQITNAFTSNGTKASRLVVTSAGNSGRLEQRQHVSGSIDDNDTATEPWEVTNAPSGSEFGINAWLDGEPAVEVTIITPGNETATLNVDAGDGGSSETDTSDGQIRIDSDINNPNGDRSIDIQLSDDGGDDVAIGTWSIEIANNEGASVGYHAWTYWVSPGATAAFDNGDNAYTVGSPGTAASALTVGAHAHRWRWTNTDGDSWSIDWDSDGSDYIAAFSSRGPLRGGSMKPDVTGPGQMMASAYSQDMGPVSNFSLLEGDLHRIAQGTSMSAPAVAGAAVLLFQEAPGLTSNDLKDLIMDHATVDASVTDQGPAPNTSFGAGKVDVLEAMTTLLGGSGERELLSYDGPWTFNDGTATTVGGGGSDAAALRFTPSLNGLVTGTYITSNIGGTNDLNDPLEIEVWTDNGGTPDQQIGQTVTVNATGITPFSPNYISLMDAEAAVSAGTDYHIVVQPQSATDEITLAGEDGSTASGRSQVLNGGTWSGTNSNLLVRAEVASTDGVGGALPVELAGFNAISQEDRVMLHWETLSETNNSGFAIEHRSSEAASDAPFETLAFVDGQGTTTTPQSYQFETDPLPVGEHTFRLLQFDLDGTETMHEPVAVRIGMQQAYQLSAPYPNPSAGEARLDMAVRDAQHVTVSVYNLLGQRVLTLHDGAMDAEVPITLNIDGSSLASGMYFVRVQGERFTTQQKFTRVR